MSPFSNKGYNQPEANMDTNSPWAPASHGPSFETTIKNIPFSSPSLSGHNRAQENDR